MEVNFLGTDNLMRAIAEPARLERFVLFSTSEIFGLNSYRADELMSASIGPVHEARWSYAVSKLACECLVHAYHKETGLPGAIVRPFNVFGPRRLGDNAMLRFIINALRGTPIEVHGKGDQIRSWCYIDDFVDGVIRTMTHADAPGGDFNLGNEKNTLTIYELAKRVKTVLGSDSPIVFKEYDFTDIDIRIPSISKARTVLGFEPVVEIEEGIERAADWYRANVDVDGYEF